MSLSVKLVLFLVFLVLLSILPLSWYDLTELKRFEAINLRSFQEDALRRREKRLKDLGGLAVSMAKQYRERVMDGEFSDREARRRFMDRLRALRYDDGYGYFWIHEFDASDGEMHARVVFHPTSPHVVGRSIEVFRDLSLLETVVVSGVRYRVGDPALAALGIRETHFLVEMNRACAERGEGFVQYFWTKPSDGGTTTEGYRKLAYVKLIPEWNWVVGVGAYLDDIEADEAEMRAQLSAQFASLTRSMLIAVVLMTFVAIVVGIFAADRLTRPLRAIAGIAGRIAKGDYEIPLPEYSEREVVLVRDAIARMTAAVAAREQLLKADAEELARLNENLEALNKVRRALLSNVSHELRTPLLSILGYCELLGNEAYGPLSETQKEKITSCIRNAESLVSVIEDLLTLSADAGRLRNRPEAIDLTEIVRDGVVFYRRKIKETEISFLLTTADQPLPVLVERDRVMRAVIHLMAAAIRQLAPGSVLRGETVLEFAGDRAAFRIEIPGLSIAEEDLPKLFDLYARTDKTASRMAGAGATDLPAARQIVIENSGEIHATAISIGVVIEISFPLAKASDQK
jgi:signal transduction histidine kinase